MFVTLLSPILELQHAPLPQSDVSRECASIFYSYVVFTLDLQLSLSRSLGARQTNYLVIKN